MAGELRCPLCEGRLEWTGTAARCVKCGERFEMPPEVRLEATGGSVEDLERDLAGPAGPPPWKGERYSAKKARAKSTLVRPLLGVLGIVVALLVAGSLWDKSQVRRIEGPRVPAAAEPVITEREYLRIADGMSYRQVRGIVGAAGTETARNRLDGVGETVAYQWINADGSNAAVVFQNDRVVQRAQFGLE